MDQAGVVTTAQLLDGGLTRRVIARLASSWEQPCKGIHITGPKSWTATAWAGLLKGGDRATLGGQAAAFLHAALRDAPEIVEVWTPGARTGFTVGAWHVDFRRGSRTSMGRPRRTNLETTLMDMAASVNEDAIIAAAARALAQRKTTPERLLRALNGRTRVRHSAVLMDLCGQAGAGIESALEWRFGMILRRHGLPLPERQVASGRTRVDALFREQLMIVELDGARDHTDWSRDMLRDNERLIGSHAITLRFGWNAVTGQPCVVAAQVAVALASRGWTGSAQWCSSCPTVRRPWSLQRQE